MCTTHALLAPLFCPVLPVVSSFSSGKVRSGSAVHRSARRHQRGLHLPGRGRAGAAAHLAEERADSGALGTRQTPEQQQVKNDFYTGTLRKWIHVFKCTHGFVRYLSNCQHFEAFLSSFYSCSFYIWYANILATHTRNRMIGTTF